MWRSRSAVIVVTMFMLCSGICFADIDDGLVAYFPFEGNLDDASGNGVVATASGTVSYTTGVKGLALVLDGATQLYGSDSSFPSGAQPRSLSVWVQTSLDSEQGILFYGSAGDAMAYYVTILSGSNCQPGVPRNSYAVGTRGIGSNVCSGIGAADGRWHHLATTFDGLDHRVYVDGHAVASGRPTTDTQTMTSTSFHIGSYPPWYLEGNLDEFRFYDRALEPAEVQEIFLAGPDPLIPPSYEIRRGVTADGLVSVGSSALPWIDPDDVLAPSAPPLLFYRIEGVSRLHILEHEESIALYTAWPSGDSMANSDDWLVDNHTGIGLMQPRLLVVNFSNDKTPAEVDDIVEDLMGAVKEATRWHGYEDPDRQPFLEYRVEKLVDLRDDPPVSTCDGNSTRYPRKPGTPIYNFEYSELYGETFAEYYGYPDPSDPGRFLTLAELVERGIVHEVWFLANHGSCGAPLETVELKQHYNVILEKTGYGPAGNGHDSGIPWIGRSLRLTFINPDRGTGCAMENLGHGWEGYANYSAIGYLTNYLREYAAFDLDTRWGLPFSSFYSYGGGDHNSFPQSDMLVAHYQGVDRTVLDYVATGGNVHFMPNGRTHYDLLNPDPVLSTIKSWRTGNGPGGEDLAEAFTIDAFQAYYAIASDCMGPWMVYWRQNMPGLQNAARDDLDRPMRNWWPFLFY